MISYTKRDNKMFLITGGTGMVGNAFKQIIPNAKYPDRADLDLTNSESVNSFLDNGNYNNGSKYNAIIHLAAKVGGVKINTSHVADFYSENMKINNNLLKYACFNDIPKVVSLLSTCVYPDAPYVTYPLTEEQLHMGPPHQSNFGYAYAKRMVDVMSRAYRQQYGCNFITAIPNNLYGENDNYDLNNSHVIPALTRKIWEAKIKNQPKVEVWGDGSPLREFTYSLDIAKILLFLLENYDEPQPINIGNTEEYSIKEVIDYICELLEYEGKIFWNTNKPNGQFKKPSSNKKLLDLGWKEEDYTPFKEGLKKTCEWFKINYPNVRGV
jgi:GDP-L-fucose synthase